jgi:hypothetical protein
MTNPVYKGKFKKEPLSLGLPVLDKDLLSAYFSKLGKKGGKKLAKIRDKKFWQEMQKKGQETKRLKKLESKMKLGNNGEKLKDKYF